MMVYKCDNQLTVKCNGNIIYDNYYDGNPDLDDEIQLNLHLNPGNNKCETKEKQYNATANHHPAIHAGADKFVT